MRCGIVRRELGALKNVLMQHPHGNANVAAQFFSKLPLGIVEKNCEQRPPAVGAQTRLVGEPVITDHCDRGTHIAVRANVTHARNLTGKLMLFVGEMDENVDPASTMQLANALIKADKDFDLVVIPGAGHGSAEGKYGTRRRADFFVRNLLGSEPRKR